MSRTLRMAIVCIVVAALYGAWFLLTARPERESSWPIYLALAFVAGLLGLGGELVAGLITEADSVSDPLPKRVGRLLLLLVCAALFIALLYAIFYIM